jgi:tetratricopeptide (TPR) repeat protein
MKKFLILLGACAMPMAMMAQAEVVSAYNANANGDYAKAAEYIEQAMNNPKATAKDKTWRYRGEIYANIANDSTLAPMYPDALEKSYQSFLKAREIDVKGVNADATKGGLLFALNLSMNNGIKNYNKSNYAQAAKDFEFSNTVSETAFDSTFVYAVYNSGLCFEKAGDLDKAIEKYTAAAELNYQVPDIYVIMVNLLSNADRTGDALAMAKAAREKYPRNKGLILEELNIYLRENRLEEALTNLDIAIEEDGSNEVLVFSKGSVLDNLGRQEEAQKEYERALEIKPDFYDALYNLGAMFFNNGAEKVNAANEVPPKQQKLYEGLMEEAKQWFLKAKPLFEKAHTLKPDDTSTIRSLRDIYARSGEDEKLMEMSDKLKALDAK